MMAALRRHPFALIFLLALLLRVGYLIDIHDTPISLWHAWKESDMDTFLTTARQIQDQGLLLPRPHHPYHMAHAQTGTVAQWERWLGGEQAYYRVPGYYYVLALLLALSKGSILAVKVVHAFLGAGHALLLGLIGSRMMGRRAGIFVGLLAAIYGPFIATESMILREGVGLFLAAAGVYLALRAAEGASESVGRSRGARWLGAGIVLGLGALIKETGGILFAAIWLWVLFHTFRSREPIPRAALLLLFCGFLLPFTPLVMRNVLVDAPLLGSSAIFSWNFAIANAVDNPSGGVVLEIPETVPSVMREADARPWDTVRLTWQKYEGRHGQFFDHWWTRFSTLWSNVETPDNFSYDFLVLHSPLLTVLPRFVCIWLPAVLTLGLLGWQWIGRQRGRQADQPGVDHTGVWVRFAPGTLSLILIALSLHVLFVSLTFVSCRYRLLIVPFLMLLAGWTIANAVLGIQQQGIRRAAGWGTALVLLSALWWQWPGIPEVQANAIRPTDFSIAAGLLELQGNEAGAKQELKQGLRYCDRIPVGSHGLREECTDTLARIWEEFFGKPPTASE